MIVVDTNVIAYLWLEGERTEEVQRAYRRDPCWRVPPLWRSEFLNVLATGVRNDVIVEEQALILWSRASGMLWGKEIEPRGEDVLATAIRQGISAYDAQFVCVAVNLGCPLVTADLALVRKCPGTAVALSSFGSGSQEPIQK
jgi:predicted nucleic acid-binding protein